MSEREPVVVGCIVLLAPMWVPVWLLGAVALWCWDFVGEMYDDPR